MVRTAPSAFLESRTAAPLGASATSTQSLWSLWVLFLQLVDACITPTAPSIVLISQSGYQRPRFSLTECDGGEGGQELPIVVYVAGLLQEEPASRAIEIDQRVDLVGTYYNTKPQVEALDTLLRKLPDASAAPTVPAAMPTSP